MTSRPDSDSVDRSRSPDQLNGGTGLEDRAQRVLESITDPFYLVDREWRFVFVNQRAIEYFGLPREQVVGRSIWDVFPKTIGSVFHDQFTRAISENRTAKFETVSPITGRVVEVSAYPSAEGLSVSFRDVTERRRAEARDRFLVELDDATRALIDAEAITRAAARMLVFQLDVDRAAYAEGASGLDRFEIIGDYCRDLPSTVGRYPFSAFGEEFARSCRDGIPYVVDDVEGDPRTADVRAAFLQMEARAVVAIPLHKHGAFAGGLAVHSRVPRHWEPHEIDLVAAVANRCWESIERARLTRALMRKTQAFRALAENGTRLLAEDDPQVLIESLFRSASVLAQVDCCLHYLYSAQRDRLMLAGSYGVAPSSAPDLYDIDVQNTVCGIVATSKAPLVLENVHQGGDEQTARVRSLGVRAYACYPLVYSGGSIGTISFGSRTVDAFAEEDLEFLRALSDQIAAAYGRARAAAALRDGEERLLQAAAIAGLGTFDTDLGTADMTVNEPGRAIYGWAPDVRLTFASAQAQFHADDRERVVDIVRAAFDGSGSQAFDVEHRIVRTDGAVRWIRVRGRALVEMTDGIRRATRCLGTFVDITERKDAEERRERILQRERAAREEAERLGRLKDEFLATVSHELRTPLNAILGWSQLLRRRALAQEETQSAIETIDRNARAQAHLIDDLLDMNRIVSGSLRVDMQRMEFGRVLSTAVESITPSAETRGVEVRCTIASPDTVVFGDGARLQQVAWNLLSNAVKFTARGGRVDVRLEQTPLETTLTVSDTGIGIQADFLPHIFEPFRQQDASSTRRHGGVGLGLSIAKRLVELHGGSLRVSSEGEGRGSTFVVSLPGPAEMPQPPLERRGFHRESIDPATTKASVLPLLGIRVMVVDDEPDTLDLLRRVLEHAGATVLASEDPNDALRRLPNESVDVLVSDIGMPQIDGIEFIRQVRASPAPRAARVRAIAVTAYARPEDRDRALASGYERYISKPVDVDQLTDAIARMARQDSGRRGPM
jgi:PAS domain S-box-containing protein